MMAATTTYSVYDSARNLLLRGWSVIPLIGKDTENGKRAAVPWQTYQNRMPTEDELQYWFVTCGYPAFGVVCGYISKLIVIDFDDLQAAENFKRQFPEFANTYIVKSGFRGTPHFYYRVNFPMRSTKMNGGDLKAEGGYVVGAGSSIANKQWTALSDVEPLELSKSDFNRLWAALKVTIKEETVASERQTCESSHDLAAFYRREVLKSGQRNNSLFKTAIWMRDCGYLQHEAIAELAQIHAAYPGLSGERENYDSRHREAIATIASAYSCPARQRTIQPDDTGSQLPNILRENLMKMSDGAAFLRTYEALLLNGIRAGEIVTRPQLFKLLGGIVGQHSINRALKMIAPNGKRLFAPSPEPPTPADADTDVLEKNVNKCFVDQKKPHERGWHRPAKRYVVPEADDILQWFGANKSMMASDAVQLDDLTSAKKYRQTLELKLIERKPGQYPQGWLGDRLGVCERTIYSYHKELPIETTPCYTYQGINWENLCTSIPSEAVAKRAGIDIRGRFLEDENGKRYPAIAGLAQKLLGKGHSLLLKQRKFNHYHIKTDIELKPIPVQEKPVQTKYFEKPEYKTFWYEDKPKVGEIMIPVQREEPHFEPEYSKPEPPQVDLKKVEQLAVQVKELTTEIDSERAISFRNARQLIDLYGISSVQRALYTMKHMHERGRVTNPAGFMVIASRVNWCKQQTQLVPTPKFRGTSVRIRRRYFSESKYDPYWHLLQMIVFWLDDDYRAWRIEFEREMAQDCLEECYWTSFNISDEMPF